MKSLKIFVTFTSVLVVTLLSSCSADRSLPGHGRFFQEYKTTPHYRAISTTGSFTRRGSLSAYFKGASSVEEAIEGALQRCEEGKKEYTWETPIGECRLYAIGDIIVNGMSDDELEAATKTYKNAVASGQVGDSTSSSDYKICNFAITMKDGTASWESRAAWLGYVNEAKGRGLTLGSCAEILG